ncbi:MAG TPA: hypothetical protein VEW47_00390 [Candidatus Dormibacteraeota bacterium]|nr:hypothetical protein [Candidatus Dormibacteraeota bacterium]
MNSLRASSVLFLTLANVATAAQLRSDIKLSPGGPVGTWDGSLGAELILTDNAHDLVEQWNLIRQQPVAPASEGWPRFVLIYRDSSTAKRGIPLQAGVFFTGCASGGDGRCDAVVRYAVEAPGGRSWIEPLTNTLWARPAPTGERATEFGEGTLDIVIGPDDPLGAYTLQAEVLDQISGRRASLSRTFTAIEAGAAELDGIKAGARAVLAGADRLELLSLDPEAPLRSSSKGFHGFKILGKTVITSEDDRRRLFFALNKGEAETSGMLASCFNPRHGIRASKHGQMVDLVICFECLQVVAYLNNDKAGGFLTSKSPQPVFDSLLSKAGVRFADKKTNGS